MIRRRSKLFHGASGDFACEKKQDMSESTRTTGGHAVLADLLRDEIGGGTYPVGSRFPTEPELQERFGVGRHTIREALKLLAEQGILGRRRKTGTTVLAQRPVAPYVHSLRDLKGLFDFAQSTQLDVRHYGFASSVAKSFESFSGLREGRWLRVAGVRSTRNDQQPLCWSEVFVPEKLAPALEAIQQGDRAIYEVIMDEQGLKLDYVEQEVSATTMPAAMADLLHAGTETAALAVKRRYVANNGQTFELSYNLYPATRYSVRSVIRQRI